MNVAGIVAEYNPFHNGHAHQIRYAREVLGADYIIAVMSGDYVQRGTPALLPKHIRAEMALKNGVDLVLELPVRISTSSAEGFASGGVELLHRLGCVSQICFGSECGEIEPFQKIAPVLSKEPEAYRARLNALLKQGKSFPLARAAALSDYLSDSSASFDLESFLSSPNNILGLEYCKALIRLGSPLQPVTLKRSGSDYHDTDFSESQFPSASALRILFSDPETKMQILNPDSDICLSSFLSDQVPEACIPSLENAWKKHAYLLEKDLDLLLHQKLLSASYKQNLTDYEDVSPALSNRIEDTLNAYQGFVPYTQLLKTRDITYTRVQRALLHILLELKKESASHSQVAYARILGFRKDASPLLKEIKQKSEVPLLTKLADASRKLDAPSMKLLMENTYASNVYEAILCSKTGMPFRHEFQKPVLIF